MVRRWNYGGEGGGGVAKELIVGEGGGGGINSMLLWLKLPMHSLIGCSKTNTIKLRVLVWGVAWRVTVRGHWRSCRVRRDVV